VSSCCGEEAAVSSCCGEEAAVSSCCGEEAAVSSWCGEEAAVSSCCGCSGSGSSSTPGPPRSLSTAAGFLGSLYNSKIILKLDSKKSNLLLMAFLAPYIIANNLKTCSKKSNLIKHLLLMAFLALNVPVPLL
jgi:hypothetical protein